MSKEIVNDFFSNCFKKLLIENRVKAKQKSLKITCIYFTIGCLWILLSDKLVGLVGKQDSTILIVSIAKGWFYIFITSILIFLLVFHTIKKVMDSEDKIKKMNSGLENTVFHRTIQLQKTNYELVENNEKLEKEIFERERAEKEIMKLNDELEAKISDRTYKLKEMNFKLEETNITLQEEIQEHKKTEDKLTIAKEKAEVANLSKSQFLANMSHEIRTPLNGIMGMLQLLQITELTKEQEEYIEVSKISSDSLLKVLNDILDYSKIEAGKMELEKINFNLKEVVQDAVSLFKLTTVKKGLLMEALIKSDVPDNLLGDPFKLRQIISNLMGNAVKFTNQGGITIDIRNIKKIKNSKIKLEFIVKDTGIGIPSDKIDFLFKSFSQVDNSNTRKYGGTGLGLAISKSLVELMEGEIWVESREGEGSSFHFTCVLDLVDCFLPKRI